MPRGRHRHSPPLHRLLLPVAVAVAALACAGAAWFVGESGVGDTETVILRGLTAAAALSATAGAVLLRSWDRAAGRKVAALRSEAASAESQAEERHAELSADTEELRDLRQRLEQRMRDKRAELAGLRSEHADLLRRYAQAETERANALEGRRQLQLEAAKPTMALPATATDHRQSSGAPSTLTYLQAAEALRNLTRSVARQREQREAERATEAVPSTGAAPEVDGAEGSGPALRPVPRPRTGGAPAPGPRSGAAAGSPSGSGSTRASRAGVGPGGDGGSRSGDTASDPGGRSGPPANREYGRGRKDGKGGGFDFFGTRSGAASRKRDGGQEDEEPDGGPRGDGSLRPDEGRDAGDRGNTPRDDGSRGGDSPNGGRSRGGQPGMSRGLRPTAHN
ncbi:hypothetical protein E0L36_20020 [Streptomyces sp. AJS327]|uniref:hypothetical protein n=1 Tax=Streptomyces sp. AJS327 TaxID=2545265 RepID=UPI0015DEAEA0|nr:hypothetical protein [Streptomyces sp. AJS327]MBA0053076.1 hypothetical protein [Streptomyces sp. AJS327]